MRKNTTIILATALVIVIFAIGYLAGTYTSPQTNNTTLNNTSNNTTANIASNNNTTLNNSTNNTTVSDNTVKKDSSKNTTAKTSTKKTTSKKKTTKKSSGSGSSSDGEGKSAVDSNGYVTDPPDDSGNWVISGAKWKHAVTYKNGHYYDYHGLNVDHKYK